MSVTIYPTGTTIYAPQKCWNGYTIFHPIGQGDPASPGATLIDMNGNVVNQWKGLDGFPNKMLPGGYVMGSTSMRNPRYGFQDMVDLVQVDWDGNVVWKYAGYELVSDPDEKPTWMARQHHDYQREGSPVGYFAPGTDPLVDRGRTLILSHKNLKNSAISEKLLLDDTIIEVAWDGKIAWEWRCSDHFMELGFSDEARVVLSSNPGTVAAGGGMGDWMHINAMSDLGPNRWFDVGDKRFHPDNIIWSSRQSNIMAITDKKTGKIVWQLGPDYQASEQLRKLGQIIGQHHSHMIPRGLPGEGNILVFDNGGRAGYGAPNPGALTGFNNAIRDYSRVLEFDPLTLDLVWQYTPKEAGFNFGNANLFYSSFVSSAQRLQNGNTMITEGADGRVFEVTREHEIVWEYVSPYRGGERNTNMIYRAYRIPYDWVPRLARPEESAIQPADNSKFRVPGFSRGKAKRVTTIKGR